MPYRMEDPVVTILDGVYWCDDDYSDVRVFSIVPIPFQVPYAFRRISEPLTISNDVVKEGSEA